ncbi:MAG: phosphate ABC transporter permease subunit PstC [Candidatus Dormibacteraeota bacterium]|nr:phosphate ABC transporter permease subunit PstC [Candidatus Dormibacteraeota bacterium]MBV9526136.1 phosphate ABC transporter permease subunit PstC [Candidatus Dormibacteraeota bacterium]
MAVNAGVLGAVPRRIKQTRTGPDRVFRGVSTGAGLTTLVILVLIGGFLVARSLPAFQQAGTSFFTTLKWQPDGTTHHFGIVALLYWTVIIALIALVIAVPVSIACALFINEYAPRLVRNWLRGLVDLLAAIPSVIYGIWGLIFLEPLLVQVSKWMTANLGGVPIFATVNTNFAGSAFVVGVVVSLMVVPICTSVMREVFAQAPAGEKEAALALGSTKWGMIRTVVIPFGRGGIVGGSMLGLGRALGETIAVALVVSPIFTVSPQILQSGANSIAAHIALQFSEASPQLGIPGLMAAGLTLFGVTLVVNFLASMIVARSRSGSGVEL